MILKNKMDKNTKFVNELNSADYSLAQKMVSRLKRLFFDSWGKDWRVVLFSLRSAKNRGPSGLLDFLIKNKKISLDLSQRAIIYKNLVFYFGSASPEAIAVDLISIWSSADKYFKKNFIDNSAYFFEGPYEEKGFNLKEGDVIIDAGANIGLFSILAAQKIGSKGKVFAFEPIKETADILRKNLAVNKIDNVIVIQEALGEKEADKNFFVSDLLVDSSAVFEAGAEIQQVKMTSLDVFLRLNNVGQIDFLKADIEGMERDFLAGAKETIAKYKPKITICFYHRRDDKDVLCRLIKKFVPEYKIKNTKTKSFFYL